MNNNIYLHKSLKTHNISKNSNNSYSNIIKNYQPKYKVLNKYFRLEELKHEEKVSRFKDGFIDPTEKPNFFFMRSDLKTKSNRFIPSTNLCAKNRNKTFLLKKYEIANGFTNYSGRKIETEPYPHNFDDIQSLIEVRQAKKNIIASKYLLNNKDYQNINNNINLGKSENCIKIKKEEINNKKITKNKLEKKKKINLFKNIKSDNLELTKSIILTNNKNNKYKLNLDNDKKKRPITAKCNRKISIKLINKNKINMKVNNRNREIKSANTQRVYPKSQRDNIKIQTVKNSNCSIRNISSYTTTFKSNSKSLSKQNNHNKIFKNIEKDILNPNSNIEKNEFKSTKQIINRIINDCNIIDIYIKNRENDNSSNKNDKEQILLKLADRLKKNKIRKLKIRRVKSRKIPEDEKVFEEKLEKIPYIAKKFFRDVYKQILFEKRVLNKVEKVTIMDAIEEKQTKKKLNEEIKKEAKEKMIITRENIITEKDDKLLLEEQRKLFDFYGNLDGLEWLITKRNVMNFGKNL